jgi:hypothetical protein
MTMYTYYVYDKSNQQLVFKYDAEEPIEWGTYPFSNYDHVQNAYESPTPQPEPAPPHVRLTKLEFLRRFTASERIAMRQAATQSPQMEDFLHMFDMQKKSSPTTLKP